jgi:hypothetical protein
MQQHLHHLCALPDENTGKHESVASLHDQQLCNNTCTTCTTFAHCLIKTQADMSQWRACRTSNCAASMQQHLHHLGALPDENTGKHETVASLHD